MPRNATPSCTCIAGSLLSPVNESHSPQGCIGKSVPKRLGLACLRRPDSKFCVWLTPQVIPQVWQRRN